MNATNPYAPPNSDVGGETPEPVRAPDYALNPWTSVWTQPRATIQQVVETNPERWVLLLAAISGISGVLDRASMQSLGDKVALPMIIVVAILAGSIGGIIYLYAGAGLLRWTGNWIGGTASSPHIRAALAWSNVPLAYGLLVWTAEIAIFGAELFTTETPRMNANESLIVLMIGFAVIEIVLGVWAIVLVCKTLGQVQGFSAWKALGNLLLALLIVVVPIGIAVAVGVGVASFA